MISIFKCSALRTLYTINYINSSNYEEFLGATREASRWQEALGFPEQQTQLRGLWVCDSAAELLHTCPWLTPPTRLQIGRVINVRLQTLLCHFSHPESNIPRGLTFPLPLGGGLWTHSQSFSLFTVSNTVENKWRYFHIDWDTFKNCVMVWNCTQIVLMFLNTFILKQTCRNNARRAILHNVCLLSVFYYFAMFAHVVYLQSHYKSVHINFIKQRHFQMSPQNVKSFVFSIH